jgi:O-antigen/teichoic acid export membrane protein
MFRNAFNTLFVNKNQVWTLYAQLSRLLFGFAFIAILTKTFSSEMLGTWYIFLSMFGVISLIEMGLVQVMGRHAAYLKADYELGRKSASDFLNFVKMGERLYFILVIVIIAIATPLGIWWLNYAQGYPIKVGSLAFAWLIYVVGGGLAILSAYYVALVSGAGKLWLTQKVTIIATLINALALFSLFIIPPTLLVPAISVMLGQLWLVIVVRKILFRLDVVKVNTEKSKFLMRSNKVQLSIIGKDTARMFLIMIYYHLLTNGFFLVLSKYLTLEEIGSYGLTMQLSNIVISLSIVWAKSNFFDMASTHKSSDNIALRKIFFSGFLRSVAVSIMGFIGVVFFAPVLLSFLESKTSLPSTTLMSVILACIWIEFLITQFSQMLIARGDMRVAYYSLFTAVLILSSTIILLNYEYSLKEVFLSRVLFYMLFLGIPVMAMARKALGQYATASKGGADAS